MARRPPPLLHCMPDHSSPAATGIGRDLRSSLITVVAVVLALAMGAFVFLAGWNGSHVSLLWLAAFTLAAIALLSAGFAYKLVRGVERPLTNLAGAARAAAGGDLSQPADEHGVLEYRDIALALNRLASELRAERHQRTQLEKLADAGRMAAGIAHEISNPLTSLSNSVELLRQHQGTAAERRLLLDRMDHEIGRAGRISNGLIDIARPRHVVSLRIDVNDVARSAMRLVTDQGVFRGHRGTLVLDPSDLFVHGNRHDLEQVFVNLLLNAVDATPPDGRIVIATHRMARAKIEEGVVRRTGDPPLTIRPRREAPRVRDWLRRVRPPAEVISIVVADSGPGVPREDWERVFQPFYTTKPPGQGTGLGLAVVANLVESMHGTVWLDKAREGGAAVHMLFPVAVGGASPATETESRSAVSTVQR